MSSGILFVVATPIGNLDDWSTRGAETLATVDWIACEDSRSIHRLSRKLSSPLPPIILYRDFEEKSVAGTLLQKLKEGQSGALITDAGTPGISDPGFRLVRACRCGGIEVRTVPGPSSPIALLSISGLPTDAFLFLGFLPPKSSRRRTLFSQYAEFPHTLVFLESVHRIEKCLTDLSAVLGPDRIAAYGRELTKLHETSFTGSLASLQAHLMGQPRKGEYVIAVAPARFQLNDSSGADWSEGSPTPRDTLPRSDGQS